MRPIRIGCVLVTHNRIERTKDTLESLWRTLPENASLTLLAYDNASTDDTPRWLRQEFRRSRFAFVALDKVNRYPGFACNTGWGHLLHADPTLDLLMMTDNDIHFLPGWLEEAVAIIDGMPEMGQVGLLTNLQDTPPELRHEKIIKWTCVGKSVNTYYPNVAGAFVLRPEVYRRGARWPEGDWSKVTWPAFHFGQEVIKTGFKFCNTLETVAYESAMGHYAEDEAYYREKFKMRGVEGLLEQRLVAERTGWIKEGHIGGL